MIRLGLIGYPLGHSFSPTYFADKFRRSGIEGSYDLFPIRDFGDFPDFIRTHSDLDGFNTTIPYKQAVMPWLDSVDAMAARIGAVNTVRVVRGVPGHLCDDFRLEGYNTDWLGFSRSLEPLTRHDGVICTQDALLLGTGGAAHAVACALENMGIGFTAASRRPGRDFAGHTTIAYSDIDADMLSRCFIVVNCTPLGMSPDVRDVPPLPWESLGPQHLCYDLVYNPPVTEFMRRAASSGAAVKNGLEMLHGQAEAAWMIWTAPE